MACVLTGDRLAECEAERNGWPVDSSQQAPGANWRCTPASPLQPASVHIVCHGTALTGAGRACGSCMVSPPVLQAQRLCQNCCPDIVLTSCSWSMKQTRCRHPSRVHVHVTPRCGTPRASPAAATGGELAAAPMTLPTEKGYPGRRCRCLRPWKMHYPPLITHGMDGGRRVDSPGCEQRCNGSGCQISTTAGRNLLPKEGQLHPAVHLRPFPTSWGCSPGSGAARHGMGTGVGVATGGAAPLHRGRLSPKANARASTWGAAFECSGELIQRRTWACPTGVPEKKPLAGT